jgi:positive regulator of sigma E activity
MSLLQKLNKLDHRISKWIHRKDHLISTVVLYPFAAFFHPGLIWLAYLTVYLFCHQNLRFTGVYALATLACLLITTFIKKIAKRFQSNYVDQDQS